MKLQLCFWQFECKGGEYNGLAHQLRPKEKRGGNKLFAISFKTLLYLQTHINFLEHQQLIFTQVYIHRWNRKTFGW